jgi:hypothetical protein
LPVNLHWARLDDSFCGGCNFGNREERIPVVRGDRVAHPEPKFFMNEPIQEDDRPAGDDEPSALIECSAGGDSL